jgi:hypothetical protein
MISNENQVSDLGFLLFLTFVKDPSMTKEIFLSGTSVTTPMKFSNTILLSTGTRRLDPHFPG